MIRGKLRVGRLLLIEANAAESIEVALQPFSDAEPALDHETRLRVVNTLASDSEPILRVLATALIAKVWL